MATLPTVVTDEPATPGLEPRLRAVCDLMVPVVRGRAGRREQEEGWAPCAEVARVTQDPADGRSTWGQLSPVAAREG